jgi:hypothetical protein
MPVQLIIDGNGITDILAQVHQLADATGRNPALVQHMVPNHVIAETTDDMFGANNAVAKRLEKAADAKLSREEQDVAVEEMIAAGAKDIRYEQLTKGRQRAVDDGIAANEAADRLRVDGVAANEAAKPDDQDEFEDMFATDDAPVEVVTYEMIRNLMAEKAKDENGDAIQGMLVKIQHVITSHVAKGEKITIRNIPEDKLATVYAELKALEA